MDDIHASIGIVQVKKLKEDLDKRVHVRKKYIELLGSNEKLTVPFISNQEFVSNYIFPIVLKGFGKDRRDALRNALHEKGIQTSVHYPAVHRFSIYKPFAKSLPLTEMVTDNEITLPMFGSLTDTDVEMISNTVNEILQK